MTSHDSQSATVTDSQDFSIQREAVDLLGVFVDSLSATALRREEPKGLALAITYSWATPPRSLMLKVGVQATLIDREYRGEEFPESAVLAQLAFDLVLEYRLTLDAPDDYLADLSESAMLEFSEEHALNDAFPFIRQMIHDLTGKLGYSGLTVGMLKVGA